MGRTLLLAQHPFRDMVSRALLEPFGNPADPVLLATPAPRAPPGFRPVPPDCDPAALGVTRVVLAGAFAHRAETEAALALAARAVAAGAVLEGRSLTLEAEIGQREPPSGHAVLHQARVIEVRDHHSANFLLQWRMAPLPVINPYPERAIAVDATLAARLPAGPILGLAIRGGSEMEKSWRPRLSALRALLQGAAGWPVLPLPVIGPGAPGDDWAGTLAFLEATLPGATILLPELADFAIWRRTLSPARLRGLVSRCAWVVTNRDLPAAFAVAEGVRLTGIALGSDRRIVRCMATLANALPPGSELLHPVPDAS
jgi:hypothetical protein